MRSRVLTTGARARLGSILGGVVLAKRDRVTAVGFAVGSKRGEERARIHCLAGEMAAEWGMAHGSMKDSRPQRIAVRFAVEDSGESVCEETVRAGAKPDLTYGNRSAQ